MALQAKTRWVYPSNKPNSSDDLATAVLRSRGFDTKKIKHFLSPSYPHDLGDPFLLPDMKKAIERITIARQENQKIVIYGDYDIDGITASTLLYDFFCSIGIDTTVYIPSRFEEGYGLHKESLKTLHKGGTDLVITVDCGVTATSELEYARKIGLDVIITDHHEPPAVIPTQAIALINPKLPTSKYPFLELAGVGVAFALVRALIANDDTLIAPGHEKWLLDLVALGTICDVVELTGENRTLAYFGLKVLRQTKRVGLRALAESSNVKVSEITESDLGFRFGPRLNAAGRLEHAKIALALMTETSELAAQNYAVELNDLNTQRQLQTQEIFESADKLAKKQRNNGIIVLADPDWNNGVVGIVASRIAEKYHKPTILMQILGDEAKGSARSFGDISIIDAIRSCDSLLLQSGGHQFAAGLKIKTDAIPLFTHEINKYALENFSATAMFKQLNIDYVLSPADLSLSSVESIAKLTPYGNANTKPSFSQILRLKEVRYIGQNLSHVKFRFEDANAQIVSGIAFSAAHKWPDLTTDQTYEVVFYIEKNTWQGVTNLQIEVIDLRLQDKKE